MTSVQYSNGFNNLTAITDVFNCIAKILSAKQRSAIYYYNMNTDVKQQKNYL